MTRAQQVFNFKEKRMFKIKPTIFIHIILVFLFYGCGAKGNSSSDKSFFFVQLSDPQIGFYPDSIKQEIASYEKAVFEINRLKPDFVVITGDLVNVSNNKNQLTEFHRITSMINQDIPVYYTPGNHDVGNKPTKTDIDFYKLIYGYDRFSFKYKGSRFIGFDSNIIVAKTPKLVEKQYHWLEKQLKHASGAKHIILFCHTPFFLHNFNAPEKYYSKTEPIDMSLATRGKYFSLFSKYHVDAIYAGHWHRNARGKYKNIAMVTTSSVAVPLGKDPKGFRIVAVTDTSIYDHYYGLDSIPAYINLKD
jgi:3',5'-cyclic AMP phosphodiesterase CpdA